MSQLVLSDSFIEVPLDEPRRSLVSRGLGRLETTAKSWLPSDSQRFSAILSETGLLEASLDPNLWLEDVQLAYTPASDVYD